MFFGLRVILSLGIFASLTMLLPRHCTAQTPSQIDQYLFNGLVLNPAYAGSREVLHGALMIRQQWTGYNNAPFLGTFALDGISKDRRHGFGTMASLSQRETILRATTHTASPLVGASLPLGCRVESQASNSNPQKSQLQIPEMLNLLKIHLSL